MGDKAAEMGSRHGAAGANKDLERRSRETRQQEEGQEVGARGIGPLYRWTGGPGPKVGGESGAKSIAAQSKGGGWGGESGHRG